MNIFDIALNIIELQSSGENCPKRTYVPSETDLLFFTLVPKQKGLLVSKLKIYIFYEAALHFKCEICIILRLDTWFIMKYWENDPLLLPLICLNVQVCRHKVMLKLIYVQGQIKGLRIGRVQPLEVRVKLGLNWWEQIAATKRGRLPVLSNR